MPSEFQFVPLGTVATESLLRFGKGNNPPAVAGVDSKRGITRQTKYQSTDLSRYKLLSGGMFAYNPMRLNIGAIGMLPAWSSPVLVSPDYIVFRCSDALSPVFLDYVSKAPCWTDWVTSAGTGSVRSRIYFRELARMPIPLPPRDEQERIAQSLSTVDSLIDELEQQNLTLEAISECLFKSWFIDFDPVRALAEGRVPIGITKATLELFPSEFQESLLGQIPRGWEVGSISDLFTLQRGFDLPATQRISGPYPVLAASGPSGTHRQPMARAPGVVTGRSGVLGRVYYVQDDYWPLNTSLWVNEFRRATPAYAYQLLKTQSLHTLNAGSAVPTLNRNHVHNRLAILPPPQLVAHYTEHVEKLLMQQDANSKQITALRDLRDTLIPRLVLGKLRVPEAQEILEVIQ